VGALLASFRWGNTIVGWLLFGFSVYAAVIFVHVQSTLFRAKSREKEHTHTQSTLTFDDNGFGVPPEFFVLWTEVQLVRKTPDFWALHYIHDGKQAFMAIPSDAIDGELSSLITDARRAAPSVNRPPSRNRGIPGWAGPIVGPILGMLVGLLVFVFDSDVGTLLQGLGVGAFLGFFAGMIMWLFFDRRPGHGKRSN